MDGERDPINLLFLFKMIPNVVKTAGDCVEYFAEEFFDVICCYYPISFKTDENDPRGITAKDLSEHLKESMMCTPHFAHFAIPFYLEKLSSSQQEVKVETLQLFGDSCLKYGRKPLVAYSSEIWPSLKTEMLRASDNEILDVCLVTIGKVCKALCDGSDSDQYKLNTISGLIDSALKELMSPESKMAPLYALMLKSACLNSVNSCRLIFNHVVPQLLLIFEGYEGRDKKSGCLTMFSRLLESIYIYDSLKDSKLSIQNY
jgi:DNA repair/transcription protein MET18/MMS19